MSALAQAAPRTKFIDVRHEPSIPRLFVTLHGALGGDEVARALSEAYLAQPAVTLIDMLFDLTGYQGAVEAQHVEVIVAAYRCGNRDPSHPCRTAFVTTDPFFDLWAAAMSFQFAGREHRAFATFDEAERFLAEPIGERPPFARA